MAVKIFSKPLNSDVEQAQINIEQVQNNLAHGLKIGEIKLYSGSTAPSRWKICDGSVISRLDYSALFDVIGTTWGGGDGETTFALPDFNGRTPVGVGESTATGHSAHTLGQMAGEETHTLSVAELASHNHGNPSFNSGVGGTYRLGTHSFLLKADYVENFTAIGGKYQGSSSSHNTMQPYSACNFIIYTGIDET